jgi:hypothetical protein
MTLPIDNADLEAVQLRERGRWHAVIEDERGRATSMTYCGLNWATLKAHRTRHAWGGVLAAERCQNCRSVLFNKAQ